MLRAVLLRIQQLDKEYAEIRFTLLSPHKSKRLKAIAAVVRAAMTVTAAGRTAERSPCGGDTRRTLEGVSASCQTRCSSA
jgi:hypothetical protein